MITREYCQLMGRYNRWINERLYALLADLPDDERKRDRGAFFGSMHGTLNHLLWGDRMWLGRFIDEPCAVPAFGADMYTDFSELAREREVTDAKMLAWADAVTDVWLASTLSYASKVDGRTRVMGRGCGRTATLQPWHASPRPADNAHPAGGPRPRTH